MTYVTYTQKLCDCGAVADAIQQDKLYCAKCWMTNFAHDKSETRQMTNKTKDPHYNYSEISARLKSERCECGAVPSVVLWDFRLLCKPCWVSYLEKNKS